MTGPVLKTLDLSIFEYFPVSHVIDLSAPFSPISQIFDIDDEITQHDSDDESSSVSDSDPIDERVSPIVGDTKIVDFGIADQPRELRIGSDLSIDERDSLIQLLGAYLDVFAWSYEDMPGLDPSIIQHRQGGDSEAAQCRILSVVEYSEWLANVVPVPKKDDKVRVCVDFRDLKKASPKDDFPFPHIDMLVDSTTGHSMLSFMDGFFGVMSFGLKNAGATYQRAVTTLFHDMMHRDVEVYVDDMIVKSQDKPDHLAALERYMVSERGIEVDPDKIRAILDMPAPRTEREVRGFLGRLQYVSKFIARLTDICEPIFRLLRKSQPTVWDDQCQCAFERIREYLLSLLVLAPPTSGRPLFLYLSVSDVALGCMLAQLDDSGKDRAIYYLSKRMLDYETRYVMIERYYLALACLGQSSHEMVANHSGYEIGVLLISPHGDHILRSVRLAFSDRHPATNNIVEYEACILGLETALELGIRQMEVFGYSNLVLRQIQGEWKTRDVKLRLYHAYLELLVGRFDDLRYTYLPRAQNQFADALATLASMIDIPIEDDLPWYHDIYHFLRLGIYPEAATAKDKRAPRQLAVRFVICGETLYRRSTDGMLLLCLDRASADRVMREVHAGVCGPHMGGHMLALWGIDIIAKISLKSSSGHEFILVAFDYFTKWVEATSYARLTSSGVASFIRSHIICRYGVLHELISDRGVHFRAEVDILVQRYSIRHHRAAPICIVGLSDFFSHLYRSHALLIGNMEAVLPVEIEMDERRLRAADHVRAYQRKMARAFKKRVKPRPLRIGDLVLKVIRE
ncbi:Retrovirus-related Pol polyprotein from transposon opus [Vitis vinifera]|uniref:Retrovirus-related Pol polyprotein from transposon opus n=1 Tax=Vitis vinifera TaxID=29760 RepID=A0A438IF00_VITVI|nr:Retrovirus-related Pol polyprotein from transposon opus [Vitis vinifera]